MKKVASYKFIALFCVLVCMLVVINIGNNEVPTQEVKIDVAFTKHSLWDEICSYNFQDCVLVMKSVILECGHSLDSRNATHRNNLFGMRCNSRVKGCRKGYAVYDSWQHSIADRYRHEELYYKVGTSYEAYLNRNWGVMDGGYVGRLNKIKAW